MNDEHKSDEQKRERLRVIEEDIARLRAELPQPSGEPQDFVDAGQELAAREELLGRIELLENERRWLKDELGPS